jgi:RNA polymerase sigma factor (sigma-70 family)
MATDESNPALRHLRRAALLQGAGGLTDAQLLNSYLARGEDAAFEALVRRHGPMVLGVCRRVLRNPHDAEDAFQATFLVLLRKAASLLPRYSVGNWLYGVARRTALKAQEAAARRRAKERQAGQRGGQRADEGARQDLWRLLDQELDRLPEKYRAPVVLCDLEGRTRKEAARLLGWPEGTVSGRLARARALLARRLARQGVTPPAVGLAGALAGGAACASVPPPLVAAVVRAGKALTGAAAGAMSARAVGLAHGVVRAMTMTKLKAATAVLLAVGVGAALAFGAARESRPEAEEGRSLPSRGDRSTPFPPDRGAPDRSAWPPIPTAAQLVAYLNDNAGRFRAVQWNRVAIDCLQGNQAVGLDGSLVCQKPRNFRLKAKVLGQPGVDIGSNKDEFWYWIKKADPAYIYHCPHQDLGRAGPGWPFPFRPEWLLDALGLAEYDPAKRYEVIARPETVELVEKAETPQGRTAFKVTVFNRTPARVQVTERLLRDAGGNTLCRATVQEVVRDQATGAVLPRKVTWHWPAQRVHVAVQLFDPCVDPADLNGGRAERLFSRRDLQGLPAVDLSPQRVPGGKARPGPGIRIILAQGGVEVCCQGQAVKLSGDPAGGVTRRLVVAQVKEWARGGGSDACGVLITCRPGVASAAVAAVTGACRQAGVRRIEVKLPEEGMREEADP